MLPDNVSHPVWAIPVAASPIWSILHARGFQRLMNEVIEGITGVEVISDDFLVVRFVDNALKP